MNDYTCAGGGGKCETYGVGAFHDPVAAVLGLGWESLRAGDTVNVKVIYMPTGKTIFDQNIPVTEG